MGKCIRLNMKHNLLSEQRNLPGNVSNRQSYHCGPIHVKMILYKNSNRFFQTAVITEYAENSLLVMMRHRSSEGMYVFNSLDRLLHLC